MSISSWKGNANIQSLGLFISIIGVNSNIVFHSIIFSPKAPMKDHRPRPFSWPAATGRHWPPLVSLEETLDRVVFFMEIVAHLSSIQSNSKAWEQHVPITQHILRSRPPRASFGKRTLVFEPRTRRRVLVGLHFLQGD